MRRILVLTFALFALGALAQSQVKSTTTAQAYYDTFNERWLNPGKWEPIGPFCAQGLTLECVREIQNGQLRLALRNMGDRGSDSGEQYSSDELLFTNPNAIQSVTADATVRKLQLVACPTTTNGAPTRTIEEISGIFFNTGSGDPADDASEFEYFYADASKPGTITVGNWFCAGSNGPCYGNDFATYPVGTPLTATNTWDKANHQFISSVKAKSAVGPGKGAALPYFVSDTTPPVNPQRALGVSVAASNCTSTRTFAHAEALYDNVIVNAAP
jgi:hypothetical protein